MPLLIDFLVLTALWWAILLAIYFGFGTFADWLTARHPERKIQPDRDGLKRKWADIRVGVKKLLMSAGLLVAGFLCQREDWTWTPMELSWWNLILWFGVGMFLFDTWFYFTHRLLHWAPLYRFHALHHKNVAPTAWSSDNTGALDTFMEHSFYFAIWLMTPAPAEAVFAIRIANQFIGMIGHSGFEFFASPLTKIPSPFVCSTYHDMHHSTFRYNFANIFSFWDRLLGTAHPDYDGRVVRWLKRDQD